jgi:hypothetical protein
VWRTQVDRLALPRAEESERKEFENEKSNSQLLTGACFSAGSILPTSQHCDRGLNVKRKGFGLLLFLPEYGQYEESH